MQYAEGDEIFAPMFAYYFSRLENYRQLIRLVLQGSLSPQKR